jgi:hypothetical protein
MKNEVTSLEGSLGVQKYLWTVNQQVVVSGYMGYRKIAKIDRITSGRGGTIYVGKDSFDKYGHQRGADTWTRGHIEPANDKIVAEIRADFCKKRLKNFDWLSLPDWLAIQIVEAVSAKDKRIDLKAGKFIPNPEA